MVGLRARVSLRCGGVFLGCWGRGFFDYARNDMGGVGWWWCGGVRGVEVVRSRRGPHAYPAMGTASGCGTTVWGFRLGGRKDGGRGVTAVGTALTSSGSVVEGVPTRALPWIPHRGAVRRLGGGFRLGGRKDGWGWVGDDGYGGRRYPWWCDGGGDCANVERVCSRRGPHPGPTMGTASGCGTTVGGFRLGGRKDGCHLVLPVKTGIHGGVTAVGTALTSSGSVVEGVPTRALPWVPHRGAVRRGRGGYRIGVRYDEGGVGTGSGCGTTREGCDGGGDCPYVERVCSRRGPHPGPTMDTASGCGKTREGWVPDRGAVRRGRGVTAVGTALTSSGSVVEGVPTRALPWIPHRGAVRRGRGGYRLGGRKDGGRGVTAVGTALTSSGFVAEGVPTLTPPWVPHRGAVRRFGGSGLGGGKTEGGV